MKPLFLLLAMLVAPAFAGPRESEAPRAALSREEIPVVPDTEKELKAWLDGTKWLTDDERRLPCIFKGNRFETPMDKPTFSVKSRRMIVVNWGRGVKIRCVFDDQCTTMRELDGENHVFKFEGRIPEEDR